MYIISICNIFFNIYCNILTRILYELLILKVLNYRIKVNIAKKILNQYFFIFYDHSIIIRAYSINIVMKRSGIYTFCKQIIFNM